VTFTKIAASDIINRLIRMKTDFGNEEAEKIAGMIEEIKKELTRLSEQ